MFIARIELRIEPAARDAFRRYAAAEAVTARQLAGCVQYAFLEDVGDPLRVLLYEEWSTRATFDAYRGSSLFAAAGATLRPMLTEPPKSAYYESDDLFAACAV